MDGTSCLQLGFHLCVVGVCRTSRFRWPRTPGEIPGFALSGTDTSACALLRPGVAVLPLVLFEPPQAVAAFAGCSRICFMNCRMAVIYPTDRLSIHVSYRFAPFPPF